MKSLEIRRQLFHGTLGVIIVALLYFGVFERFGRILPLPFPRPAARTFLIILIIGAIVISLSRKYRIPLIHWLLTTFERPEEIKIFPGKGVFFALLGMFIVVTLFEPPIAMAAILIFSLGDSISHLIGRKFGRTKHPLSDEKFLEGHITGALAGAVAASLFISPHWALIAAFIAMFVEGIDIGIAGSRMIDDNLIVPVTAGVILFIIASL